MQGIYWPFAHLRLVHLYAQLGRATEAKVHLEVVERHWSDPDPAMRGMLDEARRALAAVQAGS